ncbi:C1QL4-like protein [Mya arenaria]|uniref:C1QL4-like protein n=1 Tax=Mya arenaria TaxID=6604 RepID=A0ABY7ELY7_MYAAR|nr:C1QL4-like protein [Mya arenaria]
MDTWCTPDVMGKNAMICLLLTASLLGFAAAQGQGNDPDAVAFSAGLTHNQTIHHAVNVVYDRVYVNVGNGYNSSSGVFTAPTRGYYVFQFHALTHLDKSSWLTLNKNDNYLVSIYGHTAADYASGGNSVVLLLIKNDKVFVQAVDEQYGDATDLYGEVDEVYSTFSGYLIAKVYQEPAVVG